MFFYIYDQDQKRFTISEVAADWHEQNNDTAAHYAAIHCPRERTIGPRFAASRHTTVPISHTGKVKWFRKFGLDQVWLNFGLSTDFSVQL